MLLFSVGLLCLIGVVVVVFLLIFLLVLLYCIVCEKVFGVCLECGLGGEVSMGVVVGKCIVWVEFDGGVNLCLLWLFYFEQLIMDVVFGEFNEVLYFVCNDSQQVVVGSVVFLVVLVCVLGFFSKIECFCFIVQMLQVGEKCDMLVCFIVDLDLLLEIKMIILFYIFYCNDVLFDWLFLVVILDGVYVVF